MRLLTICDSLASSSLHRHDELFRSSVTAWRFAVRLGAFDGKVKCEVWLLPRTQYAMVSAIDERVAFTMKLLLLLLLGFGVTSCLESVYIAAVTVLLADELSISSFG